ncbi:cytochrome c maturation protein CcmE [Pseudonocardia sp. KRD291]|uniref:cytochrome c maturation protein CcmE n=1 Tax=Pseudonocardia sp. KRD291 TaxID=2792007 RepID=UPI001C4A54CE|nr:cytochrome c maturation protein CcmE [Pseudonocardia sp. KRD291]MBW0104182.1 cytochrome c maturation protein CcmE [Pseudonocardia sp. KRD291]
MSQTTVLAERSTGRGPGRYRLLAIAGIGVVAVLGATLLFGGLNRNLVYYLTPTEAVAQRGEGYPDGRRFQLGGLVEAGSVTPAADGVRFTVTSGTAPGTRIPVHYRGAPAQLFAAGIGVVLEGAWRGPVFASDSMMVKHDENYRPPTEPAARTPGEAS